MRFAASPHHDRCTRGVRRALLCLAAAISAGATLGAAQQADEDQEAAAPRLRRVEWPSQPQAQSPTKPLAPDVALLWSERLSDPNLNQRERALDELIQAALFDPSLANHIRERAAGQDESAWTWRMARRELARSERHTFQRQTANDPFQNLLRPTAPGAGQALEGWLGNVDPFFGWDPFGNSGVPQPFTPLIQFQVPDPQALQGKSVRVTRLPDGVRLMITEQGPSGPETRNYEGPSMEALREQHPELRGLLGESGTGFGLGDLLPGRLGASAGKANPALSQPMRTDQLGVWCQAVEPGDEAEEGGVRVMGVVPLSLAQVLGLQQGDILIELMGRPLREVNDISKALAGRPEGAEIQAKWLAEGRTQTGSWRPGPEARDR